MMNNIFGSGNKAKTPFYLTVVDKLAGLYTRQGVDYSQMRTILQTKMVIDSRRENLIQGAQSTKKRIEGEEKNQFFSSLWVYTLLSSFLLILFAYDNWVFQYTTYFSFIFIMIFSTMLANFSGILLDTADSTVIGTKPVSKKTLGAAKATHIAIYLLSFSVAIGAPVTLSTFYFNGIAAGILVALLTLLAAFWCLGLTMIMYGTVLKRFDGERLRNIIAYSQIAVSIIMIVGYYMMGQIFQIVNPETLLVEMNLQLGHILLFPMWFVAPFGMLQEGFTLVYAIYTGLLIAGTLVIAYLYMNNSDRIETHLQKINSSDPKPNTRSAIERLSAKLLCFGSLEKAYFHFSWQLTKQEREFKTRLYPSLAGAIVFPAVLFFQNLTADSMEGMQTPYIYLILPYFLILSIPMMAVSVQFSNDYKGRWVFEMAPNQSRGPFVKAVTKVLLVKYIIPIYGIISVLVLYMVGMSYALQLINGLLLMSIILYIESNRANKTLPFTRKFAASEANQGCMASLFFFFPVFIVSVVMVLLQNVFPTSEWIIAVLLVGINVWWMTNRFSNKKNTKAVSV